MAERKIDVRRDWEGGTDQSTEREKGWSYLEKNEEGKARRMKKGKQRKK